MNWIPATGIPVAPRHRSAGTPTHGCVIVLATIAAALVLPCPQARAANDRSYRIDYRVTPDPEKQGAVVRTTLVQERRYLREVSMRMPASRFSGVSGDGEVRIDKDRVTWLPPESGGTLEWFVKLRHHRDADSYDAFINDDWALFRATDIIPAARTRTLKGSISHTGIAFDLPDRWSSVTQYFGRDDRYEVRNPSRRFDRPTGWILLGDIGTRIDQIAGVRVKVTGPTGESVRRLDMLALMHWALPHLAHVLPDMPKRLTIFSADSPMWRGGLSGPRSLFIHADLPLINENSTSTLLHELLHVSTELTAEPGADWIVEGLAEYYGLELLRRSRTIGIDRFRDAVADLRDWGKSADPLCSGPSTGAMTARAVAVMVDLDEELRSASSGRTGLDQVLRRLVAERNKVSVAELRDIAADLHGGPVSTLSARRLPGCD